MVSRGSSACRGVFIQVGKGFLFPLLDGVRHGQLIRHSSMTIGTHIAFTTRMERMQQESGPSRQQFAWVTAWF